tara:strand:- start:138 stop:971 length:834 start_codon:yes stop_codon:yes gene_type:complete
MLSKDVPTPEPKFQHDYITNRKKYDNVQYNINFFFGPPIARIIVPKEIVDGLNATVDRKLQEQYETHGDRLVGQINHEPNLNVKDLDESGAAHFFHSCTTSFVQNVLTSRLLNFPKDYTHQTLFRSAWAVCQFQNEYNPVHFHTNCDISSVMYLKIPKYDTRWKTDRPFKDNTVDGCIEFVSGSTSTSGLEMGTYRHTPRVGELFLFPSSLLHTVYPFLGDGERRSIAFNMAYQIRRKKDGAVVNGFTDPVGIHPDSGMSVDMIPQGIHDRIQKGAK